MSLVAGPEVAVRGPVGAATFTSDVDRLVIDNRGSAASFEIAIPATAPRVEIRVGADRIFLKDGARVTTAGSARGRAPFLLPLASPTGP